MVSPLTGQWSATTSIAPHLPSAPPELLPAEALQALGAPSDLLLLPSEGHTIVGRDSLVELTGRVIAWFDRWL
jgi:hypothetical protein